MLSLGFYCMVGGGMTPILAAGFNAVAETYDVSYSRVALTTGLYMMGLGVGSVIMSPTAILWGKRPVYILSSVMFLLSAIWCSQSPNFASLATARVFQGIAVSPVECLPSATIAEIFFLHERAYRVGVYSLLLLGGKNLVPLVSAVIIQAKGWRWAFYVVAIVVGFCSITLFFLVPETFWDRTPRPKTRGRRPSFRRRSTERSRRSSNRSRSRTFTSEKPREAEYHEQQSPQQDGQEFPQVNNTQDPEGIPSRGPSGRLKVKPSGIKIPAGEVPPASPQDEHGQLPHLHNLDSPTNTDLERSNGHINPDMTSEKASPMANSDGAFTPIHAQAPHADTSERPGEGSNVPPRPKLMRYTTDLRNSPPKSYIDTLKLWHGQLSHANWFKVAFRPFILFAYPSVLWSALVYSLSVGWLIVLSESVSHIYANRDSYNFTSLQVGLVYLSPFIGGVLGTALAGKGSDIVVRWLSRRNGGVYEPEFRLLMGLPIAITTAVGLMGFGWSAEEKDKWIVPTIFFGVISFGCSLGATTAITFCVDSYRQFAGEALVTLNFSKNILHGLVFSLFFPQWLEHDGSKEVFLIIGGIQVACLLMTIPMYVYGKRARMWTVRQGFMDRF